MSILNLNTLSVTLGTSLFTGLNLTLEKGDRIGLIAGNGRGKSTLLRCLAGTHEATSGEITRARGLRIGHLEQEAPEALLPLTLYDAVLSACRPSRPNMTVGGWMWCWMTSWCPMSTSKSRWTRCLAAGSALPCWPGFGCKSRT